MRFYAFSLFLLLGFTGCQQRGDSPAETKSTAGEQPVDRVTTGQPVKKTLRLTTEQPGRVEAFEKTPIVSKIAGYVQSVHVDLGDHVTKGQKLILLHAPEYQDQLEQKRGSLVQAESQIKQAEAALAAARATADSAKAYIAQAQASSGRAQAELTRWDSEHKRIQQLVNKGSVTPKLADETTSQFQAAEAARQEALATIESAKSKEREAQAGIATAAADVEAAKAKLLVARAEVDQAETMLDYCQLVSPFDGFVTSRHVDTGHYVQPAGAGTAAPLMTIANVNNLRVFVNVPEAEAMWVNAGFNDAAKGDLVSLQLGAGKAIEARVTRTALQLDAQSRTLSTEIDLDNRDLKIMPGAYLTAKILLEERVEVLTLPIAAIVKTSGETHCCIVVDNKIEHRPIQLGLRVGDEVEIQSGLTGTEQVVLARAAALKPGQPVAMIRKP